MSATTADLRQIRAQAIEASGWGKPFKLVQPRNLAFWVGLLLVIAGAIGSIDFVFKPGVQAYSQALTLALVVYGIYTVPLWLFLRHNDKFSAIPTKLAVTAFVYGAFASTVVMALNANGAVRSLWAKAVSQSFAHDWSAGLCAPFTEETAKGTFIILALALAPRIVGSAFDGLILGTFAGLGFQILENVSYVVNGAGAAFGADQANSVTQVLAMRAVVGIASHWLYSGLFCAGLVWLIGTSRSKPRRGLGVVCILISLTGHGVWDSLSAIVGRDHGNLLFPLMAAVIVGLLLAFRWAYHTALKPEQHWFGDMLAPEVAAGVVSAEEVQAASGSRKQRKAYLASQPKKSTAKHVLEAVRDLGRQIASDAGVETEAVAHARTEVARVRTI